MADGISVSFLKYELASTIEQAVRGALEVVLKETARVVGAKLTAARNAAAESHRENQNLRERLEVSESELKAVRYYITAAEKNIKQCLLLNQNHNHNQNHPRPSAAGARTHAHSRSGSDDHAAPFPLHKDEVEPEPAPAPRRSFRNTAARLHYNKTLPSVGLCLPTVQPDWTRNVINRRRVRTGSPVVQEAPASHMRVEAESVCRREEAEDTFYISDEGVTDKEYKSSTTVLQDLPQEAGEEEASVSSLNLPGDPSDLSKFEFEMGGPAGNVNELGLIQVMDCSVELKQSVVKIEDEPEVQCTEPTTVEPSAASSSSSLSSSHSQPQILAAPVSAGNAETLLGLLPPVEGDPGPAESARRDGAEKVHRCNVCGRGFRRFYCLKTHQRIHTGERPYPCRYCEKRFRHLDSLHKHQRIHTGERPYRCALCGCCFRELGQLKKHRLKHSPQSLATGTATAAATASAATAATNHPTLSLLPAAASSYVWSHLNSQSSLDSI